MTLVEIQASAIKRHYYSTHIEVPDHLSEREIASFIEQAFQEIDESDFQEVGFGLEIEDSSWTISRDLPFCSSTKAE